MSPPSHGLAPRVIAGPTLRIQSDRRLVRLVREGYETAFEEIVRRYGRPLARYAAAIVGSRSEDVTQDAFAKALLALRRDEAEIELRPWLYRIVRNTALNDLRDRPPAAAELAEAIAVGTSPAELLEQRQELTALMERLRSLPESQRAAIVMRELEGLSHEEIAAALGMSGGAARQAIYRARRALRDSIGILVPLPLLRAALEADSAAAAEAAGSAVGLAGAGLAVKATAATVLVAGTVSAGVALRDGGERPGSERKAGVAVRETGGAAVAATSGDGSSAEGGWSSSGPGGGEDSSSGPGGGGGDDEDRREDRRAGEDREDDRESEGPSDRSGRRSGEAEDLEDDRSGPSGGDRSSRSGQSESEPDDDVEEIDDDDSDDRSGPSESSGSGTSVSGSGEFSSSGSDDDSDDPDDD